MSNEDILRFWKRLDRHVCSECSPVSQWYFFFVVLYPSGKCLSAHRVCEVNVDCVHQCRLLTVLPELPLLLARLTHIVVHQTCLRVNMPMSTYYPQHTPPTIRYLCLARRRTPSHAVARRRTLSHAVARRRTPSQARVDRIEECGCGIDEPTEPVISDTQWLPPG